MGKGQVQQEGAQVQQRIIVRSMKSVQAQKKWNEVRRRKVAELGPVCKSWKISIEPKEKNHTVHRWCPYVYGFSGDNFIYA